MLDTGYSILDIFETIQQPVSSIQHPVSRTMDNTPTIKVMRLKPDLDADIPLPRYMTPRAAGMDICAAVEKDFVLKRVP